MTSNAKNLAQHNAAVKAYNALRVAQNALSLETGNMSSEDLNSSGLDAKRREIIKMMIGLDQYIKNPIEGRPDFLFGSPTEEEIDWWDKNQLVQDC